MLLSRSFHLVIATGAWLGLTAQPKADVIAVPDTAADPSALEHLDHRVLSRYDRKTMLAYSVANNADGIEVVVRMTDPAVARQALRAGMRIAIDTTGKKKDSPRIEFPLPGTQRMHREGGGAAGGPPPGQTGPRPAPNMDLVNARFRVDGFASASGELLATNEQGVRARAEMGAEDVLTVGYWIPYDALVGHEVQPGTEHKAWSLTVTVNEAEFTGGGGGHGGGGHGGGGGGMRGMGGGGGGMRGGGGGMRGGGAGGGGMRSGGEEKKFRVTFAQAKAPEQ